jgi:hypothetical protein
MLARAELAFAIVDSAYIQHDILSREAFYVRMCPAFRINLLVPVSISLRERCCAEPAPA